MRYLPDDNHKRISTPAETQLSAIQRHHAHSTTLHCNIVLRGGTGSDRDSPQSQRFGEDLDGLEATQAFGDEDEEEEAQLVRLVDGQPVGVAVDLPNEISLDVLAIGRLEQERHRVTSGAISRKGGGTDGLNNAARGLRRKAGAACLSPTCRDHIRQRHAHPGRKGPGVLIHQ